MPIVGRRLGESGKARRGRAQTSDAGWPGDTLWRSFKKRIDWLVGGTPPAAAPHPLPPKCSMRAEAGAGPVSRFEGALAGVATNASVASAPLAALYTKYAGELLVLRRPARSLCLALRAADRSFCASDDIESEITYMRVREAKPRNVLELAPRAGYSSFFILAAQLATRLTTGAPLGVVHSYDLEDVFHRGNLTTALRRVQTSLVSSLASGIGSSAGQEPPYSLHAAHQLHIGDARPTLPARLDAGGGTPFFGYLFFDAAHTGTFGAWIGAALLRRQAALAPAGTPASIHDVFHNFLPSEEGEAAFGAVPTADAAGARLRASAFSAAKCRIGTKAWRQLLETRERAFRGFSKSTLTAMHAGVTANPTIYMTV